MRWGVGGGEVLIAARPWDVDRAKRAGLRGAWLDRGGHPYPNIFARPGATARDLPTLADTLLA